MGVTVHHYITLHSFVMGVLWFNAFILLGLLMRKLKFFVKFSVAPLLLLLALSVFRMLIAIDIPISVFINSETIYPAIVNFLRFEIVSYRIFGLSVNVVSIFICIWVIVSVYLIIRYVYQYTGNRQIFIDWIERSTRDEYAESLLAGEIGTDKHFRIFRNSCFSIPSTIMTKSYIILPEIDFTPDQLRVILLHEWKHIRDKDYLIGIIIDIICFVFWWNPLVYVLRKNFSFAKELKCDRFAVYSKEDFNHYLNGFQLVRTLQKQRTDYIYGDKLLSDDDELIDRLNALALRSKTRWKRIFATASFSIIIFALFIGSYMVIVLPAFWEAPDVPISEDFTEEYLEGGRIFTTEENFVVDNGDGTLSLFIDGKFVRYVDDTHELINFLPIHARED